MTNQTTANQTNANQTNANQITTNQITTVVNIKHSAYDVLIDRGTIFGNPFPVRKWGREGSIKKFESYFWQRMEWDPAWKAEVVKLKGKVLGCHCVPLNCHGNVYCDYLNTYDELEDQP